MGRLLYSVACSLDGYLADEQGAFGWAAPDEEGIAFLTEQMRGVSTFLYGRRMYEVLKVWESDEVVEEIAADSPASVAFAQVWRQASKVVFSTTLTSVDTRDTELRRRFDPEDVERLKRESTGDLTVEGPTLAVHAWRAGLVDEVHLLLVPTIVGGGLRALPEGVRRDLAFLGEQRFPNGMVQLRYAVR